MKIRNFFLAALAVLTLGAGPAFAQTSVIIRKPDNSGAQVDIGAQVSPFKPTGNATLAVTTSSARVALPSTGATDTTVVVRNTGATDAAINLGNSSVTAATTNFLLPAGSTVVLSAVGSTNIAAITASSTTSLAISTGSGVPSFQAAAGAGGGGGAGTTSNASSGVATSSANSPVVAYNYCWNGTTWDQCFPPTPAYANTITTNVVSGSAGSAYSANDAWADSTSAPTAGGFTLAGSCRVSGGTGSLLSLTIVSSIDPTVYLQGEIWLFDSSVTAVNDNAAFALSDTDAVKLIPGGVIPFTLASTTGGAGTNSYYSAGALNIAYKCSGSADLRFLIKVKNAYTPVTSEQLTVRASVVGTN